MSDSRDSSGISELMLAENSDKDILEDRENEIYDFGEAAAPFEPYQDEPLATSSEEDDRPDDEPNEADLDSMAGNRRMYGKFM